MTKLSVNFIAAQDLLAFWPQCGPLLEKGLEDSEGELDQGYLLQLLQAGQAMLLVGRDEDGKVHAAMAVQMQRYPAYTVAHVLSIGGRWVMANREHWGAIKLWLKQQGASKVQGSCKPAQVRLWHRLGMEPVYTIVREDL